MSAALASPDALLASGGTSVAFLGFWGSCCNKASAESQLILKLMRIREGKGLSGDEIQGYGNHRVN